MEQWKQIVTNGVEYPYEVSTKGNVRNAKTGRILKPSVNKGYYCVTLRHNNMSYSYRVHRLVATMFIPNTDNLPEVDHIDRNRQNNCVENLRWVSHPDNMGNTSHESRQVLCVETGIIYSSIREAERKTGIPHGNIVNVCQGKKKTCGGFHWKYVE